MLRRSKKAGSSKRKRVVTKPSATALEDKAWALLAEYELVTANTVREHRFVRDLAGVGDSRGLRLRLQALNLRDWRFDIAIVDRKIAIEIEGGIWNGGRHTRGAGFNDDCRKYNCAQVNGWMVLRFTGDHLKNGAEFITTVRKALGQA